METKGITSAKKNFLHAQRRVRNKGGKKAGQVPPTITLATPRGGPRRGPGREMKHMVPPRSGPGEEPASGPQSTAAAGAALPAGETGSGNLFSERELQGAAYFPVNAGGRLHPGIWLHGTVVVLGTDPSLFSVICRDCGEPFDEFNVKGHERRCLCEVPLPCEAPGPSLPPVVCRDCGAPFDVNGHKRRQLRKEGKCDPLLCYHSRGRRRSAYFRARGEALTAGADEVGTHAIGAAAARAVGQRARSLGAAPPP